MQVNNNQFWMQNAAQQNKQKHVNPLLKQVQHIIEQKSNAKASDAVSKGMSAKIRQNNETDKIDPNSKLVRQVMEELTQIEEGLYGALGWAKIELSTLVRRQDEYNSIVNGTADYDDAFRNLNLSPQDEARFDFVDFETYLKDNGYQEKNEFTFSDYISVEDSKGFGRLVYPGMVPVEDGSGLDKYIFEDQVQLYEQWQAEKQAHKVETLKQYATEQLPVIQERIESIPEKIGAIFLDYSIKRMAALAKLPKDFDMEEFKGKVGKVNDLFKEMSSLDRADGKKVLELLNQILEKQQRFVVGLGGTANDVFDGVKGKLHVPSFDWTLDTRA